MVRKLALIAAAAALTEQVSALSAHRHLTRDLERRLLEAESRVRELEARQIVTVYTTITGGVTQPTEPVVVPPPVVNAAFNPQQNQDHQQNEGQHGNNDQPGGGNHEETGGGSNGQTGGGASKGCPYGNASPGMVWKRYSDNGDFQTNLDLARTFAANAHPKWAWNWSPGTDGDIEGVDFIPTLANSGMADGWKENAQNAINKGAKMLFSMNEPDKADQAHMDAGPAAQFYKDHMNEFADKATLVAPSVSNGGGAQRMEKNTGLDWLQQWVDACDGGCSFDACNIHWYSGAQYGSTLIDQIKEASKICGGKPVYITEFSPDYASDQDAAAFVKAQLPELKKLGNTFAGYSFFMVAKQEEMPAKNPNMLVSGNGLSVVGQALANVM